MDDDLVPIYRALTVDDAQRLADTLTERGVEAHMEPIFDQPSASENRPASGASPEPAGRPEAEGENRQTPAQMPAPSAPSPRQVEKAKQKTGTKVLLGIIAALALISVLLAAILLEWRLIAIGAFAFFAFLLVTGAPFWYAAMQDEAEGMQEELTGEPAPSSK